MKLRASCACIVIIAGTTDHLKYIDELNDSCMSASIEASSTQPHRAKRILQDGCGVNLQRKVAGDQQDVLSRRVKIVCKHW